MQRLWQQLGQWVRGQGRNRHGLQEAAAEAISQRPGNSSVELDWESELVLLLPIK
jgi:hypothetical protein